MRTVFCRYEDCGKPDDVPGGEEFKPTCPACGRESRWATEPGRTIKERRKSPRIPYDLTINDRRMLRRMGIAANNDHESDGA